MALDHYFGAGELHSRGNGLRPVRWSNVPEVTRARNGTLRFVAVTGSKCATRPGWAGRTQRVGDVEGAPSRKRVGGEFRVLLPCYEDWLIPSKVGCGGSGREARALALAWRFRAPMWRP
jgi:hypothetical protein